ncbi:MAG: VOC family protein [Thermoplasmata archaeon]
MSATARRPGRKPHRLYLRYVEFLGGESAELPPPRAIRDFLDRLEASGRLIASGPLTNPHGDLLLYRASDLAEARRALRPDPFIGLPSSRYALLEWETARVGTGVNLEPAPARGSGRLVLLERASVFVRDREVAKTWYREVLGLLVRADDPSTGHLELALGPAAAALSISVPVPAWGREAYDDASSRIGRATGIVFQTDSVRALALRLKNGHATITQGPYAEPWGEWAIRFADPDGNEFLAFGPDGLRAIPPRPARGKPRSSRPR